MDNTTEKLQHVFGSIPFFANRPVSQLNSIRGKSCDSLYSEKFTSYHYAAKTDPKLFHALLRAMHAFEIQIHMTSRQVMLVEVFQKNLRHCESGPLMTMAAHSCQTHERCLTRSGPKDYGDTHHALVLT